MKLFIKIKNNRIEKLPLVKTTNMCEDNSDFKRSNQERDVCLCRCVMYGRDINQFTESYGVFTLA